MIELEKDGCPAPGAYPGVPYAEYSSWPAANYSTVQAYLRSAAHGHYEETHPDPSSKEQSLGSAVHTSILEPERFANCVVKMPAFARPTTKAAKQAAVNFVRENEDKQIVTADEWNLAIEMRDAVWNHATAKDILRAPGAREVCLVWVDTEYGIKCKARVDVLCLWNGYRIVLDLKTSRDARSKPFASAVMKYGYHRQGAWYLNGASHLDPQQRIFVNLVVESAPPHGVAIYQFEEADISAGHDEMRLALKTYAESHRRGIFPGYDEGMGIISLPPWARKFHGEEA